MPSTPPRANEGGRGNEERSGGRLAVEQAVRRTISSCSYFVPTKPPGRRPPTVQRPVPICPGVPPRLDTDGTGRLVGRLRVFDERPGDGDADDARQDRERDAPGGPDGAT